MNVTKVHLIRLEELDAATCTPPDAHARVELGDVPYLDINQEHRICHLAWGGKSIQLVGTIPHVIDSLERSIAEYATYQGAS